MDHTVVGREDTETERQTESENSLLTAPRSPTQKFLILTHGGFFGALSGAPNDPNFG